MLDANLAKARLNDEGIHAVLDGEHMAAMLGPVYGAAYGGIYLLVPDAQTDAARTIVREIELTRQRRTDAESPACPKCEQQQSRRAIGNISGIAIAVAFVGMMVFGFDPLIGTILLAVSAFEVFRPQLPSWRCQACGNRFQASAPTPPEG